MEMRGHDILSLRALAAAVRGDFSGGRETLETGKLLAHGSPDCARDNLLELWTNARRQRGCKMLDDGSGAFFRRHGKTLLGRDTVRAREKGRDFPSISGYCMAFDFSMGIQTTSIWPSLKS